MQSASAASRPIFTRRSSSTPSLTIYDGFYAEWANQNAKKVPEIGEAIAVRKYQKEFSPQRNGDLDGFAVCLASLGGLCEAIVSGKPSFEHVYGESFFEYLGRRPQDASVFNRAMTNATSLPAILAAYDFSHFGKIVDVGGGQGALLRGILERCPDATGVLCDVPPRQLRSGDSSGGPL